MNRPPITVTSNAPDLAPQSADAQLSALAALLSRATGSTRVVALDFDALAPERGEDAQP